MRYVLASLAIVLSFGLATLSINWVTSAGPQAKKMRSTIYDDGKSCPGGCDAHVVFDSSNNGTRYAFAPSSTRKAPQKCKNGDICTICFSEDDASCMQALYRGNGPHIDAFDFTPPFYEANCDKPNLPKEFAGVCTTLKTGSRRYEGLVNCILTPDDKRCASVIEPAKKRKQIDDPIYAECVKMGTKAFNAQFPGRPEKQRMNGDCGYEKLKTGRNSKGRTWHRLLDGACRPGTYVGKDGTDCCTGSIYAAAGLVTECNLFFVKK